MDTRYLDRRDAGQQLARALAHFRSDPPPLVLALPRGGVPVAFEVARALKAPLDVFIVRKLGLPGQEEYAMGAIASGGVLVLNKEVVARASVSDKTLESVAIRERRELARREKLYRGDRPPYGFKGRTVLLVDDGLATGSTMRAAVTAVKKLKPGRIVIAVPIASPDVCDAFRAEVDAIVCVRTPQPFYSVGQWYENFPQTTDQEVHDLLEASRTPACAA